MYSQGFYLPPRAEGEVRIFKFQVLSQQTNKQADKIKTIVLIPKFTTKTHIHHFKTTCVRPRSIAEVPFDSAGRFCAS